MATVKINIDHAIYNKLNHFCNKNKIQIDKAIEDALSFWFRKKEKDTFFRVKPIKFKRKIQTEDIDKILYDE